MATMWKRLTTAHMRRASTAKDATKANVCAADPPSGTTDGVLLRLLLLFTLVPLVELALLIEMGQRVRTWPTVVLVVVTGFVGAWLARRVGMGVVARIRLALAEGRLPGSELLDGLIVVAAGAMLLTPGLLTDATALALLSPPGRRLARGWLKRRFERALTGGTVTIDVPPR